MTIDQATGVISWPNPVENGTPYTITVAVTDGTQSAEVTWTLTVNKEKTVFISSVGSASGDGSINNPIRFIDLYETGKFDDGYKDYQVICRAGTHSIDGNDKDVAANAKLNWRPEKPLVFLVYLGEKPVFDFSKACFFF